MELNSQVNREIAYARQDVVLKPRAESVSLTQALEEGSGSQGDNERLFKQWQQSGDLSSTLGSLDVGKQQELVWSWYRNDTLGLSKPHIQQLEGFLIGDKPERWTEMFKHSTDATAQADGLLLRQELRASADFGKQQEALALKVLGRVSQLPDSEGIQQLLRNELKMLIPRNGMLDNMMRNTHKLDLE